MTKEDLNKDRIKARSLVEFTNKAMYFPIFSTIYSNKNNLKEQINSVM